jgi:hypothetical protein
MFLFFETGENNLPLITMLPFLVKRNCLGDEVPFILPAK